ncbi:NHLP leader peptide family RiPP precursor [Paenibacillus sp. HB172176]|uniref:NHLP leader peptide family RiPP precursor n=1 Tax=Paenibacillus sp. HB172176 TaxID=2493690 RepID=UPI001438C3C5|nr:NHLP leader peptide family RiPP precursor [Paenibacillus sp. HB172176]
MTTEQELKQQIIEKAWSDATFKAQLIADPKTAIKDAFGVEAPADVDIEVLEESATQLYLVLPQNPAEDDDDEVDTPRWN